MLASFESILPIFLLIVAGNLLRRSPLIEGGAWPGLEQLGYWFLYPALLFTTIVNADFSGLELDAMLAALLASVVIMALMTLSLWPGLRRFGLVSAAEFSSVFQTSVRWNGFMAFAVAERIFPPEGVAVVALAMAVIIIPINLESVVVVTRFADRRMAWGRLAFAVATNPLILASALALVVRAQPLGFYEPLNQTFDMVGRAALGMGLLALGAGLRPADMASVRVAIWLPVIIKLAICPALLVALGHAFGLSGPPIAYLALCGAVPAAMNGFLLARQLGGDAELYAAVTTLQTALSFVSIPIVIAATGYTISG